jgi:hypothetical protein
MAPTFGRTFTFVWATLFYLLMIFWEKFTLLLGFDPILFSYAKVSKVNCENEKK